MGCKSPLINIISLIYINQLELLKWSVSGIHYKLVHIDRPIFGVDNKVLRVKGFSLLGVFHDEIIIVEVFPFWVFFMIKSLVLNVFPF